MNWGNLWMGFIIRLWSVTRSGLHSWVCCGDSQVAWRQDTGPTDFKAVHSHARLPRMLLGPCTRPGPTAPRIQTASK